MIFRSVLLLPALLAPSFIPAAGPTRSTATVPAQQTDTTSGEQLFATSGCTHCHGETARGTGKGPSLIDVRKRLKPGQMSHQIKEGGKSMPPFGDALTEQQINVLVEFLRQRHPHFVPPPPQPSK